MLQSSNSTSGEKAKQHYPWPSATSSIFKAGLSLRSRLDFQMTLRGPIQPQLSYGSVKIQQHAIPLPPPQVSVESHGYRHKGSGCMLSPNAWGSNSCESWLCPMVRKQALYRDSDLTLCPRWTRKCKSCAKHGWEAELVELGSSPTGD